MTQVVFLGPRLSRGEARDILDATYLPPAAGGDVLGAVLRYRPVGIGLVDGVFEQMPSVRHKEILYALTQRVRVYGAASMGALRAAELAEFGMIGVGEIFRAFASGGYDRDDEVAIGHGSPEDDWRPTSDALVNLRWGLQLAESRGVIGPATRSSVLQAARDTFYPERSWVGACAAARATGAAGAELDALLAFVGRVRPDRKGDDARELLHRMSADADLGRSDADPTFEFAQTEEFLGWLHQVEDELASRGL